MARRVLSPKHDEQTRAKIQTSQLVNRLQQFALGGTDPKTKETVVLSRERLDAIKVLLSKTLPDLSNVTLSGDPDAPVKSVMEISWGASKQSA